MHSASFLKDMALGREHLRDQGIVFPEEDKIGRNRMKSRQIFNKQTQTDSSPEHDHETLMHDSNPARRQSCSEETIDNTWSLAMQSLKLTLSRLPSMFSVASPRVTLSVIRPSLGPSVDSYLFGLLSSQSVSGYGLYNAMAIYVAVK